MEHTSTTGELNPYPPMNETSHATSADHWTDHIDRASSEAPTFGQTGMGSQGVLPNPLYDPQPVNASLVSMAQQLPPRTGGFQEQPPGYAALYSMPFLTAQAPAQESPAHEFKRRIARFGKWQYRCGPPEASFHEYLAAECYFYCSIGQIVWKNISESAKLKLCSKWIYHINDPYNSPGARSELRNVFEHFKSIWRITTSTQVSAPNSVHTPAELVKCIVFEILIGNAQGHPAASICTSVQNDINRMFCDENAAPEFVAEVM